MKEFRKLLSLVLTVVLLISMAGTITVSGATDDLTPCGTDGQTADPVTAVAAEDTDWDITSHCICGARGVETHIGDCHGTVLTWTPWTATDSMPTESGNWYLTGNVTFPGMDGWMIGSADKDASALNVDLNGCTVTYSGSIRAITVSLEASVETNVVITDSSESHTGTIINNYADACTSDGGLLDMYGQGTANTENASLSVYRATLDGAGITSSKMAGGAIRVEMGHTLNLYGAKVLGAAGAASGSAIYNYGGNVNIADASEITASSVTSQGGAIYNTNGSDGSAAALTITDSTVTGAAATSGGAIYNLDGSVTVGGSTINGGKVTSDGGAIWNNSTLTIVNSTIKAFETAAGTNVANNGGAIFSTGTVTVTGGKIIGGHVKTSGGAIAAHGGSFTVTDVEIDSTGKAAGNRGTAVAIGNKDAVTFTMNGNTVIKGGSTGGPGGGAVTVQDTGTAKNAQFIMNGGTISGGTSTSTASGYGGGSVRVTSGGKFYMNGGTISGGTGTNYNAGGVMLTGTGTMTISGDAKITGNNGLDLYLNGRTLTIAADWEGNGDNAMVVGMAGTTGKFAVAGTGATLNADYFTGAMGYAASLESDGLYLVEAAEEEIPTVKHCLCGANEGEEHIGGCDGALIEWTPWSSTNSLPYETGYYYLTAGVTLSTRWSNSDATAVDGETGNRQVFIDLNGNSVIGCSNRTIVMRTSGAVGIDLTITDSSEGHTGTIAAKESCTGQQGALVFMWKESKVNADPMIMKVYRATLDGSMIATGGTQGGAAIAVGATFTLNLYNATVKGGSTSDGTGGAIYTTGTVNMVDSAVIADEGTAAKNGSAVAVYGGDTTMTGGKIIAGDVTVGGGAVELQKGNFTMNGDAVIDARGKTSKNYGAAVSINGNGGTCTFTMNGGTIYGGTASGVSGGGAILIQGASADKAGILVVNGGTITGGTATSDGGNIRVTKGGILRLNGGTVTGGTAGGNGNGIMVVDSAVGVSVSGSAKVVGNDIYLASGKLLTIGDNWSGNGDTPMAITMADYTAAFAATSFDCSDHFVVGKNVGAELRDSYLYGVGIFFSEGGMSLLASDLTVALEGVAEDSYIQLLDDYTGDVTVSAAATLDLNGYILTGNVTIIEGAQLKLFDSATADYTADARGKIVGTVTGDLARTMNTPSATYGHNYKYLTILESDGSYSAHRIYLTVKSVVLVPHMERADYTGTAVKYKTVFKCNDVVAKYVTAYGARLTGDNTVYTNYLENAELLTGAANENGCVTELQGAMKTTNTVEQNNSNADKAPEVCAYVCLNDGRTEEITSATVTRSLKKAIAVANMASGLTDAQELAMAQMYETFKDILDTWTDVDLQRTQLLYKWLILQEPPKENPDGIKNIIIIIGDGMGPVHVEAGELCSGEEFVFRSEEWKQAFSNTNSLDDNGNPEKLTDSAAGGTALATGILTLNAHVGTDKDGLDLRTILDYASDDFGKATGVVSTDDLAGATPGAFSGHSISRYNTEEIYMSQFTSNIDLLCAQSATAAIDLCKTYGTDYTVCTTIDEVQANMDAEKAYWQLPLEKDLSDCVLPALEYLSKDEDGFVLMIEQAHIDKYAHNNDFAGMQKSANDLNETVQTILEWIGDRDDTAIIITADHETGGLSVSADPISGYKTYTSGSGNTVYYKWSTTVHTKTPVGVWTYGFEPNFENYYIDADNGIIKNISVFDIMLELLQNP